MGAEEETTPTKTSKSALTQVPFLLFLFFCILMANKSLNMCYSVSLSLCINACVGSLFTSFLMFDQETPPAPAYPDWSSSMQVVIKFHYD